MDWTKLVETHGNFDMVYTDPPWQVPQNGSFKLQYETMSTNEILKNMPMSTLQPKEGFLAMWVVNTSLKQVLQQFQKWGYRIVGEITWIKVNKQGYLTPTLGYYCGHGFETCIIGCKNPLQNIKIRALPFKNVIMSPVTGQSEKPLLIYEYLESIAPYNNQYKLEIFGRNRNVRKGWITIGQQISKQTKGN